MGDRVRDKTPPFNMIISGMTACGKTKYMLDMIESQYSKHFETIVIICPTFEWNETYHNWKHINDENVIAIPCEHSEIEAVLNHVVDVYKGSTTLIVLDDCASSKTVKSRTSELVKLGFGARHYGLSTIVITQQLRSIAKAYRDNVSKMVVFYNPSKKDMECIIDEYMCGVSKKEVAKIISILRSVKYSNLKINLTHPYFYSVGV